MDLETGKVKTSSADIGRQATKFEPATLVLSGILSMICVNLELVRKVNLMFSFLFNCYAIV